MKQIPNSIKYSRFWISIVNILGFFAVYSTKPTTYTVQVEEASRMNPYLYGYSNVEISATLSNNRTLMTMFIVALAIILIGVVFSLYLIISNKTYEDKIFYRSFAIDAVAIIASFVFAIYGTHSFLSYGVMILLWIIIWLLVSYREKNKCDEYVVYLREFNERRLTKNKIDQKLADLKLEMKKIVSAPSFIVMTVLALVGIYFVYNFITVGCAQDAISNFTLFVIKTFMAVFSAMYLIFFFVSKISKLLHIASQKNVLKFFDKKCIKIK